MSYQIPCESTGGFSQLNRIRKRNRNTRIREEGINCNFAKKMI